MFKKRQPEVKLSELASSSDETIPKKRRAYLDTSAKTNPTFSSFANKVLRKQAQEGVDSVYENDKDHLAEKFYYLDHTAEVLENYRKLQENIIFGKVLHDER